MYPFSYFIDVIWHTQQYFTLRLVSRWKAGRNCGQTMRCCQFAVDKYIEYRIIEFWFIVVCVSQADLQLSECRTLVTCDTGAIDELTAFP